MKSRPDPPSLLDLAVDYRQGKMKEEIWTDWGSVVFYRPLGFVCVFLLARLGVEGNMVTLSGVLLLPFMVWGAFTLTPDHALIFVCALGALYCTLDCVDGSLARLARQTSAFGQFVDFAADLTYRVVIYICLGHIADRLAPPPEMMLAHNWSWLSVMLLTACLTLFLRLARNYSDGLVTRMPHAPESAGKGRGVKLIYAAFSGLDTLLPFVAVSFWWFDSLDYLVLWLLAYTLLDAGYALPQIFPRLWPTR